MNAIYTGRTARKPWRVMGRALGLGFAIAAVQMVAGAARAETIVVVRHGDRDRAKPEQPLLPAGENRAREVGKLLRGERVDHIFFTRDPDEQPKDWLRMCQTAQGIYAGLTGEGAAGPAGAAGAAGENAVAGGKSAGGAAAAKPEPMPRFGDEGAPLRQWLLGEDGKSHPHVEPTDHTDVVVLHHEAIPSFVDQLASPEDPKQGPHVKVGREDYDNVFILTRGAGDKKFTLVHLHLTPPPPADAAATQPAPGCDAGAAPGAEGAGKVEKAEKAEKAAKAEKSDKGE